MICLSFIFIPEMILNGVIVLGFDFQTALCCTFAGLVCVYVLEKHYFILFFIRVPLVRSSTLPPLLFSSSIQSHKGLHPL